jgi:hypothetical protein
LGQPRSPEAFDRMYSPPNAPRGRPRKRTLAIAITGTLAVAAAAASLAVVEPGILPWSHDATAAGRATAKSTPKADPTPPFAQVPTACEIVPAATVRTLVPVATPTVVSAGGPAASTCDSYATLPGGEFRGVQIGVQAFMIGSSVRTAIDSFEARRSSDGTSQPVEGLGNSAFERYWVDADARTAIGETVVRDRNVVLTVDYTEQAPAPPDGPASRARCLAGAIQAAQAALASLTRTP